MALSGNGSAPVEVAQSPRRRPGSSCVERESLRTAREYDAVRRRRSGRHDPRRPTPGLVRYGTTSNGVSRAVHPQRRKTSGFGGVVATMVITASIVVGLDALANLSVGVSDGVPAETGAVHVRGGESLSDVAARVAPDAPVAKVVDRIMQLNDMSSAGVRAGQTLIAPVALVR
ncbi:LysM peptidoglycan-binding domain-containing protein [Rhodococcus sp. ABRD24]|uniref:LysM peptidoglycan-binding domain-containing protein n=1 Tax=Rhodococcus sp. ABRD24 TaxID=2507582 RepID=UPI001F60058C|nr:LysM peptidoglycan-binding domain-containing protein [Rhodococcus sp. ABRD24]